MSHPNLDSEAVAASLDAPGEFAPLFDRHFNAIHAYLQRRIGPDLADELAAQTFLAAFDGRESYDRGQPDARSWLFGIATNLLRRHHRDEVRQLRAYARSASDPVLDAFDGVEARLDASRMRPELLDALADVPAEELDALLLYAWAELSYPEIARALGIPTGTVRSRLSRARGRIRAALSAGETSALGQSLPEEGGSL
jgi:RNA polymerase sigma-70 factor (ECF subfamily)